MRQPAYSQSRPDEDMLRVGGIDHDRVNSASQEGIARVHTGVGPVANASIGQLRPAGAAVGGLVDANARLAAGRAAVPLARAEVKRVPADIVRIGDQRADRILRDIGSQPRPGRIGSKSVVCQPDAATGSAGSANRLRAMARNSG